MTDVVVFGAGGHGKVVIDCLRDQGVRVVGLFDAKAVDPRDWPGISYFGDYKAEVAQQVPMIIAVGDNVSRKKLAEKSRHSFFVAQHPSALVSKGTNLAAGVMILHKAVVQTNSSVGAHVIVNTGAQIDHDCVLAPFVHIGPGAVLCGGDQIGEGSLVGAGAIIIPGIKIGKWAVIGAGAVVIDDVPDHSTVVGNPAKIIRRR